MTEDEKTRLRDLLARTGRCDWTRSGTVVYEPDPSAPWARQAPSVAVCGHTSRVSGEETAELVVLMRAALRELLGVP